MITFIYNPIDVMIKAAQNLYPYINADIQFNPSIKSPGVTTFQKGNAPALIDINAEIPFDSAIEALANELAHVATRTTNKKDPKWKEASEKILKEFSRLVDVRIKKYQQAKKACNKDFMSYKNI